MAWKAVAADKFGKAMLDPREVARWRLLMAWCG